jgi:hypothetical protein
MRRRQFTSLRALALAGAIATLAGGCASEPGRYRVAPLVGPDGGRRSLALDSQAMRDRPAPRRVPWYAYRNDIPEAIAVGAAGPTVQTSYTRTVDRLGASHGDVYDHYRRSTYRTRYRETVH